MNLSPTEQLKFETVQNCLYCQANLAKDAQIHTEDYFFQQVSGEFQLRSCPSCNSLVLSPRLTEACLPLAYGNYYTHEAPRNNDVILGTLGGGLAVRLKRAYVRRRYGGSQRLVDLLGYAICRLARRGVSETDLYYRLAPAEPAQILDFGCGGGEFLLRMKRLGHTVVGVDFDPTSLKLAREAGVEVLTPDQLASSGYQGRFDLITLAHVIEHVADPVELLRMLRGFLRPGGRLYLETPNSEAAGLTILGRYWRGLEAPRHLSVPSRAALDQALHASGFADVDYYVRGSVRKWLWGESLDAMSSDGKERTRHLLAKAPKENDRNCEFLTLMAKAGG